MGDGGSVEVIMMPVGYLRATVRLYVIVWNFQKDYEEIRDRQISRGLSNVGVKKMSLKMYRKLAALERVGANVFFAGLALERTDLMCAEFVERRFVVGGGEHVKDAGGSPMVSAQ